LITPLVQERDTMAFQVTSMELVPMEEGAVVRDTLAVALGEMVAVEEETGLLVQTEMTEIIIAVQSGRVEAPLVMLN
jgi:hypothetical protein